MAECYILTGTSGTEARERNTGKGIQEKLENIVKPEKEKNNE